MRFLIGFLVAAGTVLAADVSGIWQGALVRQNAKYGVQVREGLTLKLNQAGAVLSGSMTQNGRTFPVASGSESNGSVVLAFRVGTDSGSVRLTLNNGKLIGTLATVAGYSGAIELAKN